MSVRWIAPREWGHFLESFSAEHLGLSCGLELHDVAAKIRVEARQMVFRGLIYEAGRATALQVFIGDRLETQLTRALASPGRVAVDEDDQDGVRSLRIEDHRGGLTLYLSSARAH